jgi:glycosyltransferase involved in cell wall biosynthesis
MMLVKKKRKVIVVLGMHRSGTSAITRSLSMLGVNLGDALHPAGFDNPKGFWENRECLAINEELLHHFNSAYDCLELRLECVATDSFMSELKHRAIQLITRELDEYNGIWGFKDPRTCRLLFFWQGVFQAMECDVCFVIVLRNPLSVAASLTKREQMPEEKSYLLWLQHLLPAVMNTEGQKRVIVDYDNFMDSPFEQLSRISSALQLPIPAREGEIFKDFSNNFLEKGLRHTRFREDDLILDSKAPREVVIAYQLLSRLARDEVEWDAPEVSSTLTNLSAYIQASSYLFSYSHGLEKRVKELFQSLAGRESRIENIQQSLLKRESEVNKYKLSIADYAAKYKQSIADYAARITYFQQLVLKRDSEVNKLKRSLAEKEKKVEEQIVELHSFAQLTHSLQEKLRCHEARIAEILSSKSWRGTEPLRALRRLLRKQSVTSVGPQPVGCVIQQIAENELPLIDSGFDAEFYRKAYPDISGMEPFFHYSKYGKKEGRLPCAPDLNDLYDLTNLDRSKETILVVSHEASRTGAPILALNIAQHLNKKYNVIAYLFKGGDLQADFHECCSLVVEPFPHSYNAFITSAVFAKLISEVGVKFAIVNSIVSKAILPVLANNFVPSVCLIHEFASYTYPKNAIREVLFWANQIVFSARIVYENNAAQCEELKRKCPVILPQGKCEVPYVKNMEGLDENKIQRIRKLFRPDSLPENTVVILGAGSVQLRKGVDLFLACAARVVGLHPENAFRFVWVGHGFDPERDMVYSVYLQDQIHRSGLENHVCFTGEMADINMAYELADVLFLSSRLDPLPNVAIDAVFQQLPVICFDNTTGIADFLKENGFGESCVIPYLDVELAAQRLVTLIENQDQRKQLGREIQEVGKKLFDMSLYVDSLERLASNCVVMQETEKNDCVLIEEDGALNLDFYSPPAWSVLSTKEAVRTFVRSWASGVDMRKPFPGFHPGIYADCHGLSQTGRNSLASFIQTGKPNGPWLYDLIEPSASVLMKDEQQLRAALHIHVFFVDLFEDILQRLEGQNFHLDLLISVPSLVIAEEVGRLVSGYTNGAVDIRIVPNRGRDIGPLLTEFNEKILQDYDVIGHIHTKKSGDVKDSTMGKTWVKFLLENLIGKESCMASTILERMTRNEKLGLVFPDDPWVVGWSGNKEIAEELARQFDINELPELYFNFPVGTMFWARTEAIKPLLTKNFSWEDYPEEPLPYDGTVLHAFERLLPFVTEKTGYRMAMTYVPGITR